MFHNLKTRLQRIERKSKPAARYVTAIQDMDNPSVYRVPTPGGNVLITGQEYTRQELERMEKDGTKVVLVEWYDKMQKAAAGEELPEGNQNYTLQEKILSRLAAIKKDGTP